MPSNSPTRYLTETSTHQTVKLAGRHINLTKLAEGEGLSLSYVSRIIRGERTPSITYLRRIAVGLGMGMEGLLEAIDEAKQDQIAELRRRVS